MFEFDYNLIPLQMPDHLICLLWFFLFICSSFSIFGDASFDLIDLNADTILERLFSFTILKSGLWFLMIISSLLLSSCSFLLFLWYMWPCLSWFTFFSFAEIFSFFFRFCFFTNWFFLTLFNLVIIPFPILNMISIGF